MGLSLQKGQSLSLEKAGSSLSNVTLGLGWDAKKKGLFGGNIDLDASVIVLDAAKNILDTVYFGRKRYAGKAIVHSGDNLTGRGDGDDEQIKVDLSALPAEATTLVFTITSYRGHTFDKIENVFCRMVDDSTGKEVVRYDLRESGSHNAMIMAKVTREGNGWAFTALGNPANGKTPQKLAADAKQVA
ncbi:MAG: TerD family protein [Enterococcus sp.]|nr:TerD family protein [Enterococcus sp.]